MTPSVQLVALELEDEQSALDHIVQLEHLDELLSADQKLKILRDDVKVEYAAFHDVVPVNCFWVIIIDDYEEDER